MKIAFMGTPDFSVPVLQNLIDDAKYEVVCVVTQPDRPKGRKHKLTAPPIKVLAEKYNIPVLQPEKVRNSGAVIEILSFKPDLLVTAAYGQILPQSLLDGPPLGCVNVHASLLPEYRGAAPIQQAVIDGQKESGVTIMYMVKKLDAGDILSTVEVPIHDDDTFGSLHDKLSAAGSRLLMKTLPDLAAGKARPVRQDENRATFAPSIKHEDEQIDWSKPARNVRNLIRGLNPFPGAFTYLDGKVFKIFSADLTDRKGSELPGTLIVESDNVLFVATGFGEWLEIKECQPAGKKRMSATDFLRGRTLDSGTVLGEKA
ncbi:methionyl-tRNA formyltransferase [Sporolactobacillus shoreae]|uniref:Methionyl-tRNA formyltransferase n=1 Tax=Sporolactobacillus shoreae TaxID=1465501 RepID=A0A4Z0GU36_9BACL|nr:methionyl-tRNA formyltransferase [Sporolactobacillus shoreae]TGB00238.1 methionyl-tRNA formyltransferase [Sporolactobacillus shoreae]